LIVAALANNASKAWRMYGWCAIGGEGTMALRETLQRILTSYPHATPAPLKDHPVSAVHHR
jgi:hypothetical protein